MNYNFEAETFAAEDMSKRQDLQREDRKRLNPFAYAFLTGIGATFGLICAFLIWAMSGVLGLSFPWRGAVL